MDHKEVKVEEEEEELDLIESDEEAPSGAPKDEKYPLKPLYCGGMND
jgi:hypothetical protein